MFQGRQLGPGRAGQRVLGMRLQQPPEPRAGLLVAAQAFAEQGCRGHHHLRQLEAVGETAFEVLRQGHGPLRLAQARGQRNQPGHLLGQVQAETRYTFGGVGVNRQRTFFLAGDHQAGDVFAVVRGQAIEVAFGDQQLAELRGESEADVRTRRWEWGIRPTYNVVDTCAGEFPAATPYYYSSYEDETESVASDREKIVILGSGPNRIGQGSEFDYCCVQSVLALKQAGYETIMINSNPETVSTDFDVSDKL